MRDSKEAARKKLRQFLTHIDVNDDKWRDNLETFVMKEIYEEKKRDKRVATFSVGEEVADEVDDFVMASLSVSDAETQCNEKMDFTKTQRSMEELDRALKKNESLPYGDVLRLLESDKLKSRDLEKHFPRRIAFSLRREFIRDKYNALLDTLSCENYPIKNIESCCENVIGFVPVPVGVAGPLKIKNRKHMREVHVPMATTEGALIASTNRGCSAIMKSGEYIHSQVHENNMTRAPCIKFPRASDAVDFKDWIGERNNYEIVRKAFNDSSRFGKLLKLESKISGCEVHLKFYAFTGDAMGMNMVSKGCEAALKKLKEHFPEMRVVTISGNYCVDKKASAANWINGRGKSVVADILLPRVIVESVLKTTPERMAEVGHAKLQSGSSLAVCIGGNNAHAANIVAAIFIATGQDPAQVVSSGMCKTTMEVRNGDLYVSCDMNCVEVGTVGGGTNLLPQQELLKLLGCAGSNPDDIGQNAIEFAETIAATVLAGEISLMASLCEGTLVSSHMTYNRSKQQLYEPTHTASQPTISLEHPSRQDHRLMQMSRRVCDLRQPGCSNIL